MMKAFRLHLVALVAVLCCPGAIAGELGHYAAGLPNIRDFLLPPPGTYYVRL